MTNIERITQIKHELATMTKPILGENSVEDVDDLYQARLEYNWYKTELEDELKFLESSEVTVK